MSTLDSVLEYKRQKEAQEMADVSAIPSAIAAFTVGRQAQEKQQLDRLTLQWTLATKGLELAQDPLTGAYKIQQNPALLSEADRLDAQTKRVELENKQKTSKFLDGVISGEGVGGGGSLAGLNADGSPRVDFDTDKELFDRGLSLSQKFKGEKTVNDFDIVRNQVEQMKGMFDQAQQDPASLAALDDGLITTWKKVLDPTSVVMVQEYATVKNNLPLKNRFTVAIKKINDGRSLEQTDREALLQGAMIVANKRGELYNKDYDRYSKMGERGGLKKIDDFIGTRFEPYDTSGLNTKPYSKSSSSKQSGGSMRTFKSVAEAESAGLKEGERVKIGNKTYEWRNS